MKETPMMAQFRSIKEQYPDALLLFRCGDFYETYCEDAVRASKILNITLTHRSNGAAGTAPIDMAGFPFHALDTYLPKLVREGLRVAICDQLEDPKLTKTLVKRGVTELVTPGASYSDTSLQQKQNTFLAALHFSTKTKNSKLSTEGRNQTATLNSKLSTLNSSIGLALLDLSTGEFLVAEGSSDYIDKLLVNFAPKEVLFLRDEKSRFTSLFGNHYFTFELDDWMFTQQAATDRLTKQFGTSSLKGFGISTLPNATIAAGAILHYLDMTQHLQTGHIHYPARIEEDRYVWLDRFTIRNLELVEGAAPEGKTLYHILDSTLTPMGGRLLHRWLAFPLKQVTAIRHRQSVVEHLFRRPDQREALAQALSPIQDLERIVSKISTGRIGPREMRQLVVGMRAVEDIQSAFSDADPSSYMATLIRELNPCSEAAARIDATLVLDPPVAQGRLRTIANNVDEQLDHYRALQSGGKQYLLDIQQREIESTGIQSLKIGFNSVFGYYLEVRNTYKDQVPASWIRKQTLVNAERYITPELKQYEEQITSAEEQIGIIENRIYAELLAYLQSFVPALQADASILAQLDCLLSFATVAQAHHYVCPEVNDSLVIDIRQGRHPVIEQQLPMGEQYVANDVLLDNNSQQVIILTGPNMAGKSALLRQTALIVLMAQIGSFVPADSASIGVVDKIFTRVGASDNISQGESTFMVEMNEAAAILNNLSERSLVLFDELGRGTSTYDGISIAWAIVEYIHHHPSHAKTLFATHYHELNEMETTMERIRNYNVSVKEIDGKVIFLRKLVRGGSEHSFGIHVAKLAGVPQSIVDRANAILHDLEATSSAQPNNSKLSTEGRNKTASLNSKLAQRASTLNSECPDGIQLSIFQLDDPVLAQIKDTLLSLDIDNLTPLAALNKLNEIKHLVGGK
ncbi:MAG: DNA mismatch repair protein MutS [Paludibacteraceae bacterium]|nr:DNA mismatch repair protein MutS [Paludibacteraceae bacterium]